MRSLKQVRIIGNRNAFATVLSCPAGHKLEVVDIFAGGDGTNNYTWLVFNAPAGVLTLVDEIDVIAPRLIEHRSYNAIVLNAGESLQVIEAVVPVVTSSLVATYVDVAPVP